MYIIVAGIYAQISLYHRMHIICRSLGHAFSFNGSSIPGAYLLLIDYSGYYQLACSSLGTYCCCFNLHKGAHIGSIHCKSIDVTYLRLISDFPFRPRIVLSIIEHPLYIAYSDLASTFIYIHTHCCLYYIYSFSSICRILSYKL